MEGSPEIVQEKINQYVVYMKKSEFKQKSEEQMKTKEEYFIKKKEISTKRISETSEYKKLKSVLQKRNNKSMNLDSGNEQSGKMFRSYENVKEFMSKKEHKKIFKSFKEEDPEILKTVTKNKILDLGLIHKIKEGVANASNSSKEKIGHLLKERISNLTEYQKLLEKTSSFKSSIKHMTEIKKENFYYISKLAKALKKGNSLIEETVKNGTAFEYEYQLVTPEGSTTGESFEEDPKKNPYFNHFHHCLQSIAFVSTLDKLPDDEFLEKKVYLPPKKDKSKMTLVLDLDETLVHCSEDLTKPCDFKTPIKFTGGDVINFGVTIRPKAIEFLELMSEYFEIVIFTASHACYANIILNILDPENQFITYRMFRDSCIETEERIFIKDLRIFGNRNFEDLVIVDNACYSYCFQLENGVPIVPYFTGKSDTELVELAAFLTYFSESENKFKKIVRDSQLGINSDVMKFGDRLIENDFSGFLEEVEERIGKYGVVFEGKTEGSFKEKISKYFRCIEYKKSLERYGEKCSLKLSKVIRDYVEEIEK